MKRRQLIGYAGAGLAGALSANLSSGLRVNAQSGGSLSIQWLGHTSFLFSGSGMKILVNPFRTVGCTAGYRQPNIAADLVLISSQLLDEGTVEGLPGKPKLMYQPGVYELNGIRFQGIAINHDRVGGKRFGINTAWQWNQAGINILHLGGAAAPISLEQKILMGRPDVLLVPVGGSDKAYNAQEARQAIQVLNPKLVIPTHYRTQAADNNCDIAPLDDFLTVMNGMEVRRSNNDTISMTPRDLPENSAIMVFSYKF
ncbi:MAG: MBL fold metallo-hydrolase [Nostocales cyanobacterium 94392]|nr:MBL fold metallo-hydrolase [Nostocales cyanobacterium 94392]